MSVPRVVQSAEGPALAMDAGVAGVVASALGRAAELVPMGTDVRRVLAIMRDAVLDLAAAEPTSAAGSDDRLFTEDVVGVVEASGFLAITPRAVRLRCSSGVMPGARKIAGAWLIPRTALPEQEHHEQDQG